MPIAYISFFYVWSNCVNDDRELTQFFIKNVHMSLEFVAFSFSTAKINNNVNNRLKYNVCNVLQPQNVSK